MYSHDSASMCGNGESETSECNRSNSRRLGEMWVRGRGSVRLDGGRRAGRRRGSFGVDVGSQNATNISIRGYWPEARAGG